MAADHGRYARGAPDQQDEPAAGSALKIALIALVRLLARNAAAEHFAALQQEQDDDRRA